MNESAAAAAPDRARTQLASAVALATLGAALLASLVVPGSRAGLGLALASVVVLIAATVRSEVHRNPSGLLMVIAAGMLATAPLLRDATWLVWIDLLAALVFASIALAGTRSGAQLLQTTAMIWPNLFAGLAEVLRAAAGGVPTVTGPQQVASLARAALLTGGLVAIFASLFAWADGAFAHLFGQLSPDLEGLRVAERIGVLLLALAAGGALALAARQRDASTPAPLKAHGPAAARPTTFGPFEWVSALGALLVLFAGFVAVQFVVLFGGDEHVLNTAGLTYAEYAREGFFQLLVVAVLVIGLISLTLRHARARTVRELRIRRWLLVSLSLLTLVILASALHRLDLYVDAFGATRERLVAATICTWIGSVLIATLVSLFTPDRRWLPRAVVMLGAVTVLGLTVVNPDARIAKRNVDRFQAGGSFDEDYNSELSADATPALTRLPDPLASAVLGDQAHRLASPDGFWGANVGRSRARDALEAHPIPAEAATP